MAVFQQPWTFTKYFDSIEICSDISFLTFNFPHVKELNAVASTGVMVFRDKRIRERYKQSLQSRAMKPCLQTSNIPLPHVFYVWPRLIALARDSNNAWLAELAAQRAQEIFPLLNQIPVFMKDIGLALFQATWFQSKVPSLGCEWQFFFHLLQWNFMQLSFQKCAEKTGQYIPGDLVPQKIIGGERTVILENFVLRSANSNNK